MISRWFGHRWLLRKKRSSWLLITVALLTIVYNQKTVNRQLYRIYDLQHHIKLAITNNSLRCQNQSLPKRDELLWSQNRWQIESSTFGNVYLYSAFFDDRVLAGNVTLRINLIATYYESMKIYCHLWYHDDQKEAYVREGILNETGMNQLILSDVVYREYILTCLLPVSNYLPKFVSVSEENACKALTTLLPVLYEHHKDPPIEFGLCVVNGHGSFTSEEMVEWFEFYRLMGVEEFNLYNTSYQGVDPVLNYYVKNNKLVLDQIPHPLGPDGGPSGYSEDKIRNLRTTCLNDCMMRNMYRYRYLVVVDHDEFIVPRGSITNFHDLIRETLAALDAKEEVMSIGFVNVYFFKSFPPDLYKPVCMKTLRYRFRTRPLDPYVASKSILKPSFCFNLMNHYCYEPLPLYVGTLSYFAPDHLATNQHYRFCGKFISTPSCNELHGEKTADDTMLRFETALISATRKVLSEFN